MFDTVGIHHSLSMPLPVELYAMGWKRVPTKHGRAKWVLNEDGMPQLTWSTAPDRQSWLTATSSLPNLLYGSNVRLIDEAGIEQAWSLITDYVTVVSGRDFKARTALVGRLDVCHNFHVNETNIVPYVSAVSSVSIPRMNRHPFNDSTAQFETKSRLEKLQLYGKYREMSEKKLGTPDDKKKALGVLRLEHRFDNDAVKRLAKKHGLERRAESLITADVARSVLEKDMELMNLDKAKAAYDDRIDVLLKAYGSGRTVQRLAGFLSLLDRYGENFYQIPELNYERSTYYNNARLCREASVWRRIEHPAKLPALRLAWDADRETRVNAPKSNTVSSSPIIRTIGLSRARERA
jgi:hypothetical protein